MLQVWFSGKGRGWFCFKFQSGDPEEGRGNPEEAPGKGRFHLFLYYSVHNGVSRPITSFLLR
jgi:hypothetical protein